MYLTYGTPVLPSDSLPVLYMSLPPPPSLAGPLPCCFSSSVKWTSSVFSQPGRLPFEVPSVDLVCMSSCPRALSATEEDAVQLYSNSAFGLEFI